MQQYWRADGRFATLVALCIAVLGIYTAGARPLDDAVATEVADPSTFTLSNSSQADSSTTLLSNTTFGQACSTICIRKEFHDLTVTELDNYISAIKQLMKTPSPSSPPFTIFESWAVLHGSMYDHCHGGAPFLPWHRTMMLNFEQELQKISPNLCLPYWDESREASNPLQSVVFTKYYGAFDAADYNHCLDNGVFANTTYSSPNVTGSSQTCLFRDMSAPGSFTLVDWKQLDQLAQDAVQKNAPNAAYAYYERELEIYHKVLHENTGGVMAGFTSPADPLFYLHHTFYDKVWYDAQVLFAQNGVVQYQGADKLLNPVSTSDQMKPWQYQAADVLDTKNICYVYAAPGEGRNLDTQYTRSSSGNFVPVPLDRSSGFVGQPLALPPPSVTLPTAPSTDSTNREFSAVAWSNSTHMRLVNGTVLPINNATLPFLETVNQTMDLTPLLAAIRSALKGNVVPTLSNSTLRDHLRETAPGPHGSASAVRGSLPFVLSTGLVLVAVSALVGL